MSSLSSELPVTASRRDSRVVLAIGASLGAAFFILLMIATTGFLAEQRRVKNAALFSNLIGRTSELGTISQRVALLQFGSLGRRDSELQEKLLSEVRGELQRFTGIIDRVRENLHEGRIDTVGRSQIRLLIVQAESFRDTARKLQDSIADGDNDRELAAQMGDIVSKLVASSRLTTEALSSNALRSALSDEELAERIYGLGIVAILIAGTLSISFVLYKLQAELSLRRHSQERMQRANQELERFSAMVAHDLKGPLANIGVAAEMLGDDSGATKGSKREFVSMISDETARLRGMVQGLLRLSKVNSAQLSVERISLFEIVSRVRRALWKGLQDSNTKISVEGEEFLRGDAALLENLFQNLIENSVKYRNPDTQPEIKITAAVVGGFFEILFRDNGIGIPVELREHVFEPFYQSPMHKSGSGIGLGLCVVKRIVAVHRGTVVIESSEGPGTVFKIRLPQRGNRPEPLENPAPALAPSKAAV